MSDKIDKEELREFLKNQVILSRWVIKMNKDMVKPPLNDFYNGHIRAIYDICDNFNIDRKDF